MSDYAEFLARKAQLADAGGFTPTDLPVHLFDFQRALVEWAVAKGRGAIFADCGLGKTPMELAWAERNLAAVDAAEAHDAPTLFDEATA